MYNCTKGCKCTSKLNCHGGVALWAHSMHAQNTGAQRSNNIIYINVHIIILCSLYDRLALHMLHVSVLSFFEVIPNYISSISNHHGEQHASEVSLKEIRNYLSALRYRPNFLIGPIQITEKKLHLLADTDMLADISCIPNRWIDRWID